MTDAETTERDAEAQPATEDLVVGAAATEGGADEADELEDRLVTEGEIAGDYLEELLDLLDFDG
ncbi:single-stranded DNA-binding protein, partial [Mycobacterium sp. Lab-001]